MRLIQGRNPTATECREAEQAFYKRAAERLNKIWEPVLAPVLNKMLEIAREQKNKTSIK